MAEKRGKSRRRRHFSVRRFLKVATVYFILFLAIFGMIDYYALMAFNFFWFVALSAVLAAALGYRHVKKGRRDHVDDVADELL